LPTVRVGPITSAASTRRSVPCRCTSDQENLHHL
jgi:hypothetical protein